MKNRRNLQRCLFLAVAVLVLGSSTAHAQTGVLDTVMDKYQAATTAWASKFLSYGNAIFWILAGIEFSWIGITLALRQADIQEWVSDLVRFILITGFFFALLLNGTTWIPAIINSLRQAGTGASQAYDSSVSTNVSPSYLLDMCLNLATKVCDSASSWNPASMVFVGLFGIAILLGGAYVAMVLVCTIVEMYVVTSASMLMLGFGGSRWTRDYATKVLTYALSVGVKLMVLQLLIGLGQNFLNQFVSAYTNFSVENIAPVLVALVVLCGLVRSVPNMAQSMVSGVHVHTGGGLGAALGVAATAAGVATAAASAASGGAGILSSATKLASTQAGGGASTPGGAGGNPGGSSMGLGASIMKGMNFAGNVAGNIAKAATADIKAGMSGDRQIGTNMAQRMTKDMRGQAKPKDEKTGNT